MRLPSMIAALAALVLLTACGTTQIETVYIEPDCSLPPLPSEQPPMWEDLLVPFEWIDSGHEDWRTYDAALDDYERYEAALVDHIAETRAMLGEVCSTGDRSARTN